MTTTKGSESPERQVDLVVEGLDLSKRYGGVRALKSASIRLTSGTATALIGPNGAGKSTLIGILSGRTKSDTGSITFNGERAEFSSPREAMSHGVQLIPQELLAAPGLSIAENLMMGRYPARRGLFDRRRMDEMAHDIAIDAGLDVDVREDVGALSPAELRLMMIGKATSRNCRVLIMDEPTASLSPREVDRIAVAIQRLRERNVAVLYVSHRLNEVIDFCQDLTVLRDGRLTHTGRLDGIRVPRLIELMSDVSHLADGSTPAISTATTSSSKVLISARGMARGIVSGIDLDLREGEVVGVAGLVGSGRTEVLRLLVGADRASAGELWWHGERIARPSTPAAIGKGIVFLPEDRRNQGGFQELSVSDNVALPSLSRFRFARTFLRKKPESTAVRASLDSVNGAGSRIDSPMRVLSGGNQQKALIAKWILTSPRAFAFDEPTAGIDVGAKEAIRVQLRGLALEGAGVLVASSDNEELPGLCDRVLVMREGTLVGELLGDEITQANLLALSYGQPVAEVRELDPMARI